MTADVRFEAFVTRLLKLEGGYVWNKRDPGGETNFGITKKTYPELNIKALTVEKAKEIYYNDFYLVMKIPEIKDERIAWQIFDFSVNGGQDKAAKFIQEIVGAEQDGAIGNQTLGKINNYSGSTPLFVFYVARRVQHRMSRVYQRPDQKEFLKGWILRDCELI